MWMILKKDYKNLEKKQKLIFNAGFQQQSKQANLFSNCTRTKGQYIKVAN